MTLKQGHRTFRSVATAAALALFLCTLGVAILSPTDAFAGPQKQAPRASAPSTTLSKAAPAGVVNLNKADVETLDRLPGIGVKKAERIVAYRGKHGPFKRIKDLRRVKGFGYKTVKKLEPYLVLKGASTLGGAAK